MALYCLMLQIQLLHGHNGILPSFKCRMEMAVLKELALPIGHRNNSSLFAQIISKLVNAMDALMSVTKASGTDIYLCGGY